MKKIFRGKHFKRGLALLLAVSMVFTTNIFGMDTVLAEEAENTTAQNYNAIVFADGEEFERIRENPGLLWENEDGSTPTKYEDQWQSGGDIETLLTELSKNGLYAYIEQRNPNLEDHTINIPANMKGVIISNGWCDGETGTGDSGEEPGYSFGVIADTLTIKGTETSVYLDDVIIDTAGKESFAIDFAAAENNTSKVVFKNSVIDAQINCDSAAGTIAFVESNILKGYFTKSVTEFHEFANLLINGEAGLSFEEITGDTDVQIVFNGYPESPESLPCFNKEINLGTGTDEEGNTYDRTVGVGFRQYKELPFWLDESTEDWWEEVPAQVLEKGTQVAYFSGSTRNEKDLIGRRVYYYEHGTENNLHIDTFTGRLEEDGAESERAPYAVLHLNDAAAFEEVRENSELLWDENAYGNLWDETDTLDKYLESDGMEYVVIQATQTSHKAGNKKLELPAHIKGAVLVSDWNEEAQAKVEWQLDELCITGTETNAYLNDIVIDSVKDGKFLIDFAAAENNTSKVVFKSSIVNAQINCDSADGTIVFTEGNIIKGYSVKSATEFHEYANLLINGGAGLSFEEITGDTDVQIVFNGYPESLESLPYFNKEINLGVGTDEEGNTYDRTVCVRFWQYRELPFWLDESTEDWWEAVPAQVLEKETQVAYFAGSTRNEKELIGCRVSYYAHGTENNLHINSFTGRLEEDGAESKRAAYAVLHLNDAAAFEEIKENTELIWDENTYGNLWDETDTLDEYLESDGMEYVVIQATQTSHESENRKLELPSNIKGAVLVSDWNEKAQARVEWQLDAISAADAKEIYLYNVDIAPSAQKLSVLAKTDDVKFVFVGSVVKGNLEVSGSTDIKFRESQVYGDINIVDGAVTVGLEGMLAADSLSGYSKLNVYGDALLLVRNPKRVVIENCEFIKSSEEGQGFNLVYNGYPKNAGVLPVFKDNIVTPQDYGINLRFVQKDDTEFWDKENWWDQTPDEILPAGTQIAFADISNEKFESLKQSLWYYTKDGETSHDIVELTQDEEGRVFIQRQNPDNGKRIVDFVLSSDKVKEYDGTAFEISADSVSNNCGYTGTVEFAWESKDGMPLTKAPKDAGEYVLKICVPEGVEGYEGCSKTDVMITARAVTVSIKPYETETRKDPVSYEILWTGFVSGDTYIRQAEVVQGPETTDDTGKYYMLGTKGGDAGVNYVITHKDPVKITITEDTKPCINSVLFPKKKEQYSAVYTGEQIRPVMVVAYKYNDEKGRAKTQNLKLNVDYTVAYTNNVNAGTNTAKVTVRGIGEYAGVITKEFSITPKSIKNVTLSPVGDILYGETPTVTVMDGTHELVKGRDYEIVLSNAGSETTDTQSVLTVKGIGNYTDTSKKSAKFNILKTSTEIKSIASDSVTIEFKKLPAKGYTYSGKAYKPAVVVKDGGVKVPASQYKVLYTNNINAGTQTASVRVVGVSKNGKGYYGISKELKFDIKQKDFSKVSVSSIAARPKSGSLDYITMTVKDGKRILTEGRDYTVDYSNIVNADGSLKDVVIGQKYAVTLIPVSGGNYTDSSRKTVYVKFGQLNLASKTASVSVKIKDAAQNKVEVRYNGTLLTENTDYTAVVKQDRNKSTYTVTIKAVKKSAYKGKKVIKNLSY